MDVKIFTVSEANRMIPRLEGKLKSLLGITQDALKKQDRFEVLDVIGGSTKGNPHHEEFLENKEALNLVIEKFNDWVTEIQKTGCVLKDLHSGLIDFYAYDSERLIFLCWKLGEERIEYWHELHTGFAGRRNISELTSIL